MKKSHMILFVWFFMMALVGVALAYEVKDLVKLKDEILGLYDGEKMEKDDGGEKQDGWVIQQMESMRNIKDEEIEVPKGWNNMMVKYHNVSVLTAKLYEKEETTTTTLPEYKGCCYEKTCLTDPEKCKDLGLKLNCYEDKECEV